MIKFCKCKKIQFWKSMVSNKEIPELKKRLTFLKKELIGKTYSHPWSFYLIDKYGKPKTLKGTDNINWIVYFPKGNFTIRIVKATNKIYFIWLGKKPQ